MQTYAGIDLHSSNNFIGIINDQDQVMLFRNLSQGRKRWCDAEVFHLRQPAGGQSGPGGDLPAALLRSFDIVSWDPRGTGISEGAVDCIDDDDYDRFYASTDPSPDTL